MRRVVLSMLMISASPFVFAQVGKVTFYKDILPILQENCQECHRSAGTNYGGMVAPMSLASFEETRPWAKSIVKQVTSREMPPWDAALEHMGTFSNERVLTQGEIDVITRWTETGTSRGNPKDAPAPKAFKNNDGWMIGKPDLIVTMPEPFFVDDDVEDLYAAFNVDLTSEQLGEDVWITGFQCKPGSEVIHHFNCMVLPPEDGKLPPPPEFTNTDRGEIAPARANAGQYIGGAASGTDANVYPEGFGYPLPKGSRITFDVHYHKEKGAGTGMYDQSSIGFTLTNVPPTRSFTAGAGGVLTTFAINIPPGEKRVQIGPVSRKFKQASDIVSLMPHMHLRGSEAKFEAFYPDGTSEVLLYVPRYDFAWQTVYYFKDIKQIPADTKVEFTAWYDNSPEMAELRVFDSTKTVKYGPESTDEMMMGFIMAAPSVEEDTH